MAGKKRKAIEKKHKPTKPAGREKGELSDKDLDKASGGLNPQPLPPGAPPEHNRT